MNDLIKIEIHFVLGHVLDKRMIGRINIKREKENE